MLKMIGLVPEASKVILRPFFETKRFVGHEATSGPPPQELYSCFGHAWGNLMLKMIGLVPAASEVILRPPEPFFLD